MTTGAGLAFPAAPSTTTGPQFGLGHGVAGGSQFATPIPQDRLVRKEVSLGVIREIVLPQNHIGLSLIAPFLEVPTDDVIFQYALGMSDGLVPARAEDAESELSQKDDIFELEGRASVIDWAVKDHYSASDVSRYREWLLIQQQLRDTSNLPLTAQSATEDWQARLARDTLRRRRKIDNRMEWLIMNALSTGAIAYNDGRINFTVDFQRPAQQNMVMGSTLIDPAGNAANITLNSSSWIKSDGTGDPIGDIINLQNWFYDTYGIRLNRAIASRRLLSQIWNSAKFTARTGLVAAGSPLSSPIDPKYLLDGWSPSAAQAIIENATGLTFIEYDAVYRTRSVGATVTTNNRFLPQNKVIFLPSEDDIAQFDDTQIGFAKTLTSPHPAGNWTSGYYEWEKDFGVDPWGMDVGTGIKAFPVFLHMDLTATYTISVLDGSV
jgi:hypothetical protein